MKQFLRTLILVLLGIGAPILQAQVIDIKQYKSSGSTGKYWLMLQETNKKYVAALYQNPVVQSDSIQETVIDLEGERQADGQIRLHSAEGDQVVIEGKLVDKAMKAVLFPGKSSAQTIEFEEVVLDRLVTYNQAYLNASQKLIAKDKNSPEAIIEMRLTFPDSITGKALSREFNLFYELVEDSLRHLNPTDQMELAMAEFLGQYTQMGSFEGEKGPSFQWFKSLDAKIIWIDHQYVVLKKQAYVFTGGAHGMQHESFAVIGLNDLKRIELEDVFLPENDEALSQMLTRKLRSSVNCELDLPLTACGFFQDTVHLTENFFLSPLGITFCYNVYEIAPYVYGRTYITLRFNELMPFLKEEFQLYSGNFR